MTTERAVVSGIGVVSPLGIEIAKIVASAHEISGVYPNQDALISMSASAIASILISAVDCCRCAMRAS